MTLVEALLRNTQDTLLWDLKNIEGSECQKEKRKLCYVSYFAKSVGIGPIMTGRATPIDVCDLA